MRMSRRGLGVTPEARAKRVNKVQKGKGGGLACLPSGLVRVRVPF